MYVFFYPLAGPQRPSRVFVRMRLPRTRRVKNVIDAHASVFYRGAWTKKFAFFYGRDTGFRRRRRPAKRPSRARPFLAFGRFDRTDSTTKPYPIAVATGLRVRASRDSPPRRRYSPPVTLTRRADVSRINT